MSWFSVDKNSKTPMIRQLYSQIRESILSGRLKPQTQLPASRELANQLEISRNVVLEAYDLLYAEGFTETRRGSGTYIASGTMYKREERKKIKTPEVAAVTMGYDSPKDVINFRAGTPDLSLFPRTLWLKMVKDVFTQPMEEILIYGHPEGRHELRKAICEYVVTQREVSCHPDQIVITAGTTQAISIACHLLLQKSKDVILEDPITRDIQEIVKTHGAIIHPVPVDNDGMDTGKLPRIAKPAFVYITPSHQFPVGSTLSIQRRIDLLNYAEKNNCYIIEDDYDSEFRFDGPPLSSVHGLCPEKVVYIGTFSKTLCPAIRIGYMVLPHELIDLGRSRKWLSDLHNEVSSQLALASFIQEGFYLRHVSKMRKHYLKKRRAVVSSLKTYLGNKMQLLGSATGLHLVVQFNNHTFTSDFFESVESSGARFYPVEMHAIQKGEHLGKIMIGYGNVSIGDIDKGIKILANHIKLIEK